MPSNLTGSPTLCLVTDRRRLAAGAGQAVDGAVSLLLTQIEGAVAAGIDLVQVRELDLEARALADLVRAVVARARGTRTRVVVNDRIDVALAADAAGVHLRETSVSAANARRLLPAGSLVGRSVHGTPAARGAGAVDFLVAGTVFATVSKPDVRLPLGVEGLAEIVAAAAGIPVLAIGGVTPERMPAVAAAGARGVAAIGAFIPASADPGDLRRNVAALVENLQFAFDRASRLS